MHEFNILIGNWLESDKALFFGPLKQEERFLEFPVDTQYHTLLTELGIFRSKTDASHNGWRKDIPEGFTDITVGKLKNRITILKIVND